MELKKVNSLVELFFEKYKEKKELTNQPFLKWLKNNENDFLTWKQVRNNICLFSEYLSKSLSKGEQWRSSAYSKKSSSRSILRL